MSAPDKNPICNSADLVDGGMGVRFSVTRNNATTKAFAIRFQGQIYAYANRCAHKLTELDWNPGEFFDQDGQYLICATHGARYQPETGKCIAGPCVGARLLAIALTERAGRVFLQNDENDVNLAVNLHLSS